MAARGRQVSNISWSSFDGVVNPFPRASVTQMCNICGHLQLYSEHLSQGAMKCTNCQSGSFHRHSTINATHNRTRPVHKAYGSQPDAPSLVIPTATDIKVHDRRQPLSSNKNNTAKYSKHVTSASPKYTVRGKNTKKQQEGNTPFKHDMNRNPIPLKTTNKLHATPYHKANNRQTTPSRNKTLPPLKLDVNKRTQMRPNAAQNYTNRKGQQNAFKLLGKTPTKADRSLMNPNLARQKPTRNKRQNNAATPSQSDPINKYKRELNSISGKALPRAPIKNRIGVGRRPNGNKNMPHRPPPTRAQNTKQIPMQARHKCLPLPPYEKRHRLGTVSFGIPK
eukprot:273247_1